MITYRKCEELPASAKITYENMRIYYERFAPDWDEDKVLTQMSDLENWDILKGGEVIGAIRIEKAGDYCFLRDLQVCKSMQNHGFGAIALDYVNTLASSIGAKFISLRVLKVSPAQRLYERKGFKYLKEDEKFYYMERKLS